MKTPIERVGLFGKYGDKGGREVLERLCSLLQKRHLHIVVEADTAAALNIHNVPTAPIERIGMEIDLAIVMGGDGTLLNVARTLAVHRIPLIGVNVGRLGFLADVSTDKMDMIGEILEGHYQTEERFLLSAEIVRGEQVILTRLAFNDVVVNKGELARLIEFETYIDGQFVNGARADGIIVATPTGSTAYAMSAGGPILHPELAALVLVPICPHTLSNRPIAVPSHSHVEVVLVSDQSAHATFDGQSNFRLVNGDRVLVRRADVPVTLIHPLDRNHYEVLRQKLHWGRRV
ncbi:MAG: NAD(+) kinase [Gammaproteobacteria bacterium]|nr:NAD(+) kinase [Gammaproteobacteria bacterium]